MGLGEDMGYGHLRLDPGLPLYLLSELTMEKVEKLRSRWAEAMAQLTEFLSRQRCQNVHLAAQLTLLELPNLLGMLDWTKDRWPPERMVELAEGVERLVTHLGRPQALARATRVREQAVQKLGGWSHARFVAESASIDRLIERGELPAAQATARKVLASCLAGGDSAYPGALYNTAQAHFRTGRVFHRSGNADTGLVSHKEAQRRFQQLASAGDAGAARMAAVVLNEMGDCFQALGRLDEATAAYEECIKSAEQLNDRRSVAVAKGQFASVRRLQRRHADALALYVEAQHIFTALGEPLSVAIVLHHIGVVHEEAGQLEAAEQSYRQSLVITVRENNAAGQANTLNQLGNLYDTMGRPEDSVAFYLQSAEVHTRLQDSAREGSVRHNLADTLMKLRRYDEARQQLERALECGMPFGHTASPWKTWANLEKLERATGHAEAAMAARSMAIQSYLAYRRTGGYNQINRAQFFAIVIQAVQQNKTSEASQHLAALAARPDASKILLTLISKLQAILSGDRSLNLAVDVDLHYMDSAELQLLIASLLGQS